MSNQRFYADIMALHPEVTGSCNLVIVKYPDGETTKFVVDCGLFQESEHDKLNYVLPFDSQEIKFCLVTHNHVDHIGRLPFMVKNGYTGKIYTSAGTKILMPHALHDSLKVLGDLSKRKNQSKMYEAEDVANVIQLIKPCNYYETKQIDEHIKVTFLINGHLVGAALILIQISYPEYEDINILFTGDYNSRNMFFDVPDIPEWILNLPITVIQESTYGYMDSSFTKKVFVKNVSDCINNGGTAIVPVFSLGRAQEMLHVLKCMKEQQVIKKEIPVFLDGKLAIAYTGLYGRSELNIREEMKDFMPFNTQFVSAVSRPDIVKSRRQKIVLTTSGMASHGPAQTYLPEYLQRNDTLIQFTGYTADGTLGARIKKAAQGETVEIAGLVVRKAAQVEYTTEFSAHAKADEMINFLKQFNHLRLVLVNHGRENVKREFAERILDEAKPKMVGILGKEYFFRVNPYGLQKTLSVNYE